MLEISQQGFTFEALAAGKLPFQPEKTPFDSASSIQQRYFSEAQTERKKSTQAKKYSETSVSQHVS
jgi:hypothetical protein